MITKELVKRAITTSLAFYYKKNGYIDKEDIQNLCEDERVQVLMKDYVLSNGKKHDLSSEKGLNVMMEGSQEEAIYNKYFFEVIDELTAKDAPCPRCNAKGIQYGTTVIPCPQCGYPKTRTLKV